MKKILIISIIVIIIFLFILIETDRTFIISHNFYNYYIKFFPKQILFGLQNSLLKLKRSNFIYNYKNTIYNNFLITNKNKILSEYKNFPENNKVYAHTKTDMFEKDFSYKYIFLKHDNKINIKNIKYFPTIKKLFKKTNNIITCFFSIMENKKIIPFHRGPYSGLVRYHFPLIISNPNKCYIQVMNKKLYYDNPFMFDDTYPHKLVKEDDTLRVVLICDVENTESLFWPHRLFMT